MNLDELRKLDPSTLLTPKEVASLFRVDPKTVTRWAKESASKHQRLQSRRTVGGHRRYEARLVLELLESELDG